MTTAHLGIFLIIMLGLDIAYTHAKFDYSSFSRSRDMAGAQQNVNGLRDLTTPLCHSQASTCYDESIYQIWSLYLQRLWRYERRYKRSKWGGFGLLRVTENSTIRYSTYEFRLAFHSNYVHILHRFWTQLDTDRKSGIWTLPTSIWCPRWGWPCWNFAEISGNAKDPALSRWLVSSCLHDSMFNI